ncbi:MAG: hypothetical protein K9N21_02330 [Deltaproteobacteria bacterium]|nr:hypothetical protein [Deltaproteobacteria bacterium]
MNLGWKSIAGAVTAGLGFAAKALSYFAAEPSLDAIGDGIIALGAMIGGYGFRKAIGEILNKLGGPGKTGKMA